MSKDKFVFEWKIGDEVESKSSGEVSVISNECFSNPSRRYKPYGEAKKRYKAEKLAWQQSRMKEGDWVKRIRGAHKNDSSVGYSGGKFQLGSVNENGYFKEAGTNVNHSVTQLKPSKPPKEKVSLQIEVHNFTTDSILAVLADIERLEEKVPEPKLESENFKIEDGRLVYTAGEPDADWELVFDCGEITSNADGQCATAWGRGLLFTSDRHREIASLLDRSTAKRRS